MPSRNLQTSCLPFVFSYGPAYIKDNEDSMEKVAIVT